MAADSSTVNEKSSRAVGYYEHTPTPRDCQVLVPGAAPRRHAGRTKRARFRVPTGLWYGKTRPGVESGSKLPHSTESQRGSISRRAVEKIKRAGGDAGVTKSDCKMPG